MTYLDRTAEALGMAAGIVMVERYGTPDASVCVPMALSGAAVLRKRKIDAKAKACAVVVANVGRVSFLGHSARTAYEWVKSKDSAWTGTFEEFEKDWTWNAEKDAEPLHVVIEARHAGARRIIDLALGQSKQGLDFQIPSAVSIKSEAGWPSVQMPDGTLVEYGPRPFPTGKDRPKWMDAPVSGIIDDLDGLAGIALQANLDRERFLQLLRSINPTFAG